MKQQEKKNPDFFAETCPLYSFKKKTDNDAAVKRLFQFLEIRGGFGGGDRKRGMN